MTYLGNPAETEHGIDLTLDEARDLCEEIADEIVRECDDDLHPEPCLYEDTDDEGREWGGSAPAGTHSTTENKWPIYEEV